MPRSNSPYEKPEGFVAVRAQSETELVFDNTPLDAVPANLDPTNVQAVGAAVSYAGKHRVAAHDPNANRPMPVTMPNAMDDHQVRERSLQALAQSASANRTPNPQTEDEDDGTGEQSGTSRRSRRTSNA